MTRVPRHWKLSPHQPELAHALAGKLSVHPLVGQLLVNRGVRTIDEGRVFLDRKLSGLHDPVDHPGVSAAADLIFDAIQKNKRICIYGDYDVDGMCATAILLECLRLGGAQPRFYVPDRLEEGYGVNADALRRLREDGVDVVVTVDCGISSVEEAKVARSLGMEYIVTDHHEFDEPLPDAGAVVHPRLPGSKYPFGELCGAGVAFKLAWEIGRRFSGGRRTSEEFKKYLLDATALAAVGAICDVVPLRDENRVLAYHGLRALAQEPPLGVRQLMEACSLAEKERLSSSDVAFMIGPRLNACGRLGQARLGIELLVTRDPMRARDLARYLEEANKSRQSMERKILAEAREQAETAYDLSDRSKSPILVLASKDWHPGVIGIVASRIVDRYQRPCVLLAVGDNLATGSGRSMPGFHLQQALAACQEHVVAAGGHAMAAGVRLHPDKIDAFREALHRQALERVTSDAEEELSIDVEAPLHALNARLVKSLDALEPFGQENPSPLMLATDLSVTGEPKKVGGGDRHLSFRVRQAEGPAVGAIAFDQADRLDELMSAGGKCCLVFTPQLNEYRGYVSVQLRVRDLRPGAHA